MHPSHLSYPGSAPVAHATLPLTMKLNFMVIIYRMNFTAIELPRDIPVVLPRYISEGKNRI